MLAKRIIPCLDVRDGRVVKGVNFVNIRDAGDPVELARYYSDQGADEIVFLDITATSDARDTVEDVVERTASQVFVPLTVGGGIRTVEDFRRLLRAGADKISVNSSAVKHPQLIADAAQLFGSQCVVLAIDAKRREEGWFEVVVAGGRIPTGLDAVEWAKRGQELGAGEILLTSMDADTPCISHPAATAPLKALCKASPASTTTTAATPERRRIAATAVSTVPTGNISFAFTQSAPTSRASSPPLTR